MTNIKINLNWQLDRPEQDKIDPTLFRLLELIKKEGSLKQATEKANVSYRYAWGLLSKWEKQFKQPLVILERGRGATLSPVGEKLMNANLQLMARFTPELDNFATQFKREFESVLNQGQTPSLNIFASHGLAIGALRDLINQQSSFKLDLHFHGSLESLKALKSGDCELAGFHLPIGPIAKDLIPQYLDLLDPKTHQLIYVVKRNQGLMLQQGNPKNITTLQSLSNNNICFINRQPDSGTRLLFDQLLRAEKIDPQQIEGYHNEEFTHMAVAAMVASGAADAGFGIAPMAEKFKLDFIPLIWEHYCLALPTSIANDNRVAQIRTLLHSDNFRQNLSGCSGYDVSRSGDDIQFNDIFSYQK